MSISLSAIKTVIILIGPSGSGKSTKAAELKEKYRLQHDTCYIVSADDYFIKSGEYKFNPVELSFAHDYCKIQFVKMIHGLVSVVIVDNTNTTKAERYFYETLAKEMGWAVEEIYMDEMNPKVCASRNIHSVPLETIKKQIQRIKSQTATT